MNANFPLPKGTPDAEYLVALELALAGISEFDTDYLIIRYRHYQFVLQSVAHLKFSLGVDTYIDDPISDFKLTKSAYSDIGRMISGLSKPTLFVMEG